MVRALVLVCLLCSQLLAQALTGPAFAYPSRTQARHAVAAPHGVDCQKGRPVLPGHTAASSEACRPSTPIRGRYADRYFVTSDGVRLHYLEGGANHPHTVVFIPGWTMPAWIWMAQLDALSARYHTIAFDPRGQGESAVPAEGYEPTRRGRDIRELLDHLDTAPAVVVAWSLGVLDTLAMIHVTGDRGVAGLVLVDNSVGEEPPPTPSPAARVAHRGPPLDHAAFMYRFVAGMFHRRQPQAYLTRLTAATLRTPEFASRLLLAYPVPRTYWREAVYATSVPLLYCIRPTWLAQGENLLRKRPDTEMEVFADAGHALFIDDAPRFNAGLIQFLRQKVWP
ncbi:MAG TPA: alpha/beta hydrolase [Rhodopila sp.]|uniref:alpha/beta fold hydrolase n=1 Tax=Rhodopila sp. TaxID=2480087 RepID=UPI002C5F2095|nr:alpha/beta hydrolase [Rhodopila sp.]HVY15934.1 alpha/beta hydrolase [Rhodopila sp.]